MKGNERWVKWKKDVYEGKKVRRRMKDIRMKKTKDVYEEKKVQA